jgi:hypothetical protein
MWFNNLQTKRNKSQNVTFLHLKDIILFLTTKPGSANSKSYAAKMDLEFTYLLHGAESFLRS